MKKRIIILFLFFPFLFGCTSEQAEAKKNVVIELTDATFNQEVLNAEGLVVVDFWAEWCGPCRIIKPYMHELAQKYEGKVKVTSMNVDNYVQVARQFNIRTIPSVFFIKDGKVLQKVIGAQPKEEFEKLFTKYM
ncbi:MAG: thioredoxin [Deferribacteres bacterium]|nr:thioredoxin [candidate division KSB1 bacterium]MCB9502361.1 thioredoxin [Deferribacteres bacterium]